MLSILIPAYNYAAGVRRIVAPLIAEGRSDIEIVIHDDSSNDGVEVAIRDLALSHSYLRYIRNSPALGAVHNWNSLLQSAKGRYVILIHHDDFPLSETFATDLLGEIERKGWPDALILSNLIYDSETSNVKPGICNSMRLIIGRYWPSYLFRRNIFGSPSVLVVRRNIFEGYDPALKWLVDVDAYFRFLTAETRRLSFSRLIMVTTFGLPGGISTTIRGREREITHAERAYLRTKYEARNCWSSFQNVSCKSGFLLALEWLLWAAIKTTSMLCNMTMSTASLSAAVAHRNIVSVSIGQDAKIG